MSEEMEFKKEVQDAHKELAKINWGKVHKALKDLDEAAKEELKKDPAAFIDKLGISVPADVEIHAIDYAQGTVSPVEPVLKGMACGSACLRSVGIAFGVIW